MNIDKSVDLRTDFVGSHIFNLAGTLRHGQKNWGILGIPADTQIAVVAWAYCSGHGILPKASLPNAGP